ncbi:MAG: prolyl oligopeptidase family serine peptidase [Bryobacteraceae bacterium]
MSQENYRKPAKPILDVLDSPATPRVLLSADRRHLLFAQGVRYPAIVDLARPMLRLAGYRIDPRNNGPHRPPYFVSLELQPLPDEGPLPPKRPIALPPGAKIGVPEWSPDGHRFAFLRFLETKVELWVYHVATNKFTRVAEPVNAALGDCYDWLPGSQSLLVELIPSGRGAAPEPPEAPAGPNIQESSGSTAPVRTYQDLLTSASDERLFEHYAASQLAIVNAADGSTRPLGPPGLFREFIASPDGRFFFVARLSRPFSRLHPAGYFPAELEIWDRDGKPVRTVASLPLAEVPIDGVRTGPRLIEWKPTEPATLIWAEALDNGDPKRKVERRDRLMALAAPFSGDPVELTRTQHRLSSVDWLERDNAAWIVDYDRDRRWMRTFLWRPDHPLDQIFSRNIRDRYRDPGTPVRRLQPNGHRAIWQHGDAIFLNGSGATARGDRPFLDRFHLTTRQADRIFHCTDNAYEYVAALMADDATRFITSHESPAEPPNYYLRDSNRPDRQPITTFSDPTPQLRKIRKQLVTYRRADGVQLSFTLYLPPDYQEGTRLPTVLWAYPREYTDAGTAGQVLGSTQRFTQVSGPSHLFFLLAGYAVLDNAAMPVVGDPETVNNTYIEQIVSSAKAAIDKAQAMGVTDPERVGVGGHSYGAFMAANLLAHSDLFRAGIARSGAHNRTLTPFGFQSEPRTLWEAPEVYLRLSPIMAANRIRAPLLLVHGEMDSNSGTFPLQSERMYQAVRGNGGATRLVTLPYESHNYVAYESVAHTIAEMIDWFDKHVRNAVAQSE